MNKEYQAVSILALIMAVRIIGLFMILPVFSIHANEFAGATAPLIGLALGIYGLSQAILQLPMAMLSDRFGRKPVIAWGLGIFIVGSIYAALTHHIYGLIIARALQGAGAVGSTLLATVADLTSEENRSKAMGFMGLAVGGSFAIAMVLGPLLNVNFGLAGIFWITAGMAAIGGMLLWIGLPTPQRYALSSGTKMLSNLLFVLKDRQLLRLDASICWLHALLTASFIIIPIILTETLHISSITQTWFYFGILILAFILMLPPLIMGEKKQQTRTVFLFAIMAVICSQILLWLFHGTVAAVSGALLIFFTAFSLLEAILPAWVSKVASIRYKGAAMGLYSTAQFFGVFIGGTLGGLIFGHLGPTGVFIMSVLLAVIGLIIAKGLPQPPHFSTVTLNLDQVIESDAATLTAQLYGIAGIREVAIMHVDRALHLRIDQRVISKSQLRQSLEKSKLFCAQPHMEECRLGLNEIEKV